MAKTTLAEPTNIKIKVLTPWEMFLKDLGPKPYTVNDAGAFLRKHCSAAIFMKEESDFLRVTIKGTDKLEDKLKFQYTRELLTDDN